MRIAPRQVRIWQRADGVEDALTEEDKAEDYILACQARTRGDVTTCRYALFGVPRIGPDRNEREHDLSLLPGAEMLTVENGGHFLPLDRPDAVIEQIKALARF